MRRETAATRPAGEPATVWEHAAERPVTDLVRRREAPRPEAVEEVAKREDPDGLGEVELYHAPEFRLLLPLATLGCRTRPCGSG